MSDLATCKWASPLLEAYLEGDLDDAARHRVRRHYRRCAACRSAFVLAVARGTYRAQVAFFNAVSPPTAEPEIVMEPTMQPPAASPGAERPDQTAPIWSVLQAGRGLIEPIRVGFDKVGDLAALGWIALLRKPRVVGVEMDQAGHPGRAGHSWSIPFETAGGPRGIAITMKPTRQPGVATLAIELDGADAPKWIDRSSVTLRRRGDLMPDAEDSLRNVQAQPLRVTPGDWELILAIGPDVRIIPISLESSSIA